MTEEKIYHKAELTLDTGDSDERRYHVMVHGRDYRLELDGELVLDSGVFVGNASANELIRLGEDRISVWRDRNVRSGIPYPKKVTVERTEGDTVKGNTIELILVL